MEAKEISKNLDKIVTIEGLEGEDALGTIIGYSRGWVEVEKRDGEVIKCRAKQLELSPEQVEVDTGLDEPAEEFTEDPSESSSAKDGGEFEVICPFCDHKWVTVKHENYTCPACGKMFRVRLHPDKERYVVGLGQTASGRDTMDIDDRVAALLRGKDIYDAFAKAAETLCDEVTEDNWFNKKVNKDWQSHKKAIPTDQYVCQEAMVTFLFNKYKHLNLGMQRMNLGNVLRGAFKRQAKADSEASK